MLLLPVQLAAQSASANLFSATLATLHGVVTDASTGQPVSRALVRIEGDADTGALTDGDGRFEIPGVPIGPQLIQDVKPGYIDVPRAAGAATVEDTVGPAHNVIVTAEMPDLLFTLSPTSSIQGQIELSSGDPAQDIQVNLLRRTISDGRADWTPAAITKTDSYGNYRFGGLANGVYVLYTDPAMDSDPATNLLGAGSGGRGGYPSQFYPGSSDLAGAVRIPLTPGDQEQANMTLTLEPFQIVSATLVLPQEQSSAGAAASYSAVVMDAAGHQLPYRAGYIQRANMIQALLPDGAYSLLVTSQPTSGRSGMGSGLLFGSVDFSVAGHEVTNLRIPLTAPQPNPVQLLVDRTALSEQQPGASQQGAGQTRVLLSPAGGQTGGWIGQGMVSAYASGSAPGPMQASWLLPGAYWAHTHIGQHGLCEESFTAGGANLAREPVILGPSGSIAPMTLTLRDDCATLTLSLPQNLMMQSPGEEPFFTVYVVPDFDSTTDVEPVTLRPSTGGTATLNDLTPGSYHIYAFNATARLEYHNPDVLAALPNPGQAVTLSAGTTNNFVLELPQP